MKKEKKEIEEKKEKGKKKLKLLPKIGIILLIIISSLYIYMHYIEPRMITINEQAIYNELIPESFIGTKIIHFSDIHFGRTTNEPEIKKIIAKIKETNPDIIVFTGDLFDPYINLSENNINFLTEELKTLNAPLGKYAIWGDNDYLNEEAYKSIMKNASFRLLENENTTIYNKDFTPIHLGGIGNITKGYNNEADAIKKETPGFQIVLSHEPTSIYSLKGQCELILSGHSLGGLINFPGLTNITNKQYVDKYLKGKFIEDNTVMIVNEGLGTETISLRFNNHPTINLYRLYKEKKS